LRFEALNGGEGIDVVLLGCNGIWTCREIPKFLRKVMPAASRLKVGTVCQNSS
jgi:hypothetical protein